MAKNDKPAPVPVIAAGASGDELSREVSISLRAEGFLGFTGSLTLATRSRAVSAGDRLLGGIIGWPAAAVERLRSRSEGQAKRERLLMDATTAQAVAALSQTSALGEATAQRFIADELRKQENLQAVWSATQDALRLEHARPPGGEDASDDKAEELDPDWINIFANYAERASSDRLRDLWGRILAGQVRKPGSFSPATLRAIAELDGETARLFEEVARTSLENNIIRTKDDFQGELFYKITFLEEAGLIAGIGGNYWLRAPAQPDRSATFKSGPLALRMMVAEGQNYVSLTTLKFTRIGREIASILERDHQATLELAAKHIDHATSKELCVVVEEVGGRLVAHKVRDL